MTVFNQFGSISPKLFTYTVDIAPHSLPRRGEDFGAIVLPPLENPKSERC